MNGTPASLARLTPIFLAVVALSAATEAHATEPDLVVDGPLVIGAGDSSLDGAHVRVIAGGTLTVSGQHAPASLTVEAGGVVRHNRGDIGGVDLDLAGALVVETGGLIDAAGLGYRGGRRDGNASTTGETAGVDGAPTLVGGAAFRSGGSHGGRGGSFDNGWSAVYGSAEAPSHLGSGGGAQASQYIGGNGGGRIRIEAASVTVDGIVRADGQAVVSNAGGGSGGSVHLVVRGGAVSGTGSITALGGGQGSTTGAVVGGGGRIAITGYGLWSFDGTLSAAPATAVSQAVSWGGAGTIFLRAEGDADGRLLVDGQGRGTGLTPLLGGQLGELYVRDGAQATASDATTVVGAIVVEDNGRLTLSSVESGEPDEGPAVLVGAGSSLVLAGQHAFASLTVEAGGVVRHNRGDVGGVDLELAGALVVETGGLIDAAGLGYRGGRRDGNASTTGETAGVDGAPTLIGGAAFRSGGSYGGRGGSVDNGWSAPYGSAEAPSHLGSGGGAQANQYTGGNGGGRIRLAAESMVVDGTIRADGQSPGSSNAGAGSGGSVHLILAGGPVSGAGRISAEGGTSNGLVGAVPGGGGRIAITGCTTLDTFTGVMSVAPGAGGAGATAGSLHTEACARPFRLALSRPAGVVQAGVPVAITVRAVDELDNTLPAYRGTVALASSDGAATLPAPHAFDAVDGGAHDFAVVFRTAGVHHVLAQDTEEGTVNGSLQEIVVVAGEPANVAAGSGGGAEVAVGGSVQLCVLITDTFGNPVPGATVGFEVAQGGGSLSTVQATSGADGLACTTLSLGNDVGSYSVSSSLPGAGGDPFVMHVTGIDVTPPTISDLQPADGAYVNDPMPEISAVVQDEPGGSGIDPGSIELRVNGELVEHAYDPETGKVSYTPEEPLEEGLHAVSLSVADFGGNVTATVTVEAVVDTTPPVITPPASTSSADYGFTANVHQASTVIVRVNGTEVDAYNSGTGTVDLELPEGVHTVVIIAVDAAGNETVVEWTFTVDTTPPTTVAQYSGQGPGPDLFGGAVTVTLVAADNLSGVARTEYRINGGAAQLYEGPFAVADEGVHTVWFRSIDAVGNEEAWTSRALTIDLTPPTVVPPADVVVEAGEGCVAEVALAAATVVDHLDAAPTVTHDAPAGGVFPLGTTTVTFTATDAAGNQATTTATVEVVDTTPPSLAAVADALGVEASAQAGGTCGAAVALAPPAASDACDGSPAVASDAPAVFPLGTTTVTFIATDAAGNQATTTATVEVVDTTPPSLAAVADVLGVEASAQAGGTCGAAVALATPAASDACDGSPAVTNDAPAVFPLGTTTVTFTATDAAGNQATTTATVEVVDTTPPSITGLPAQLQADATGTIGGGVCGAVVALPAPILADACDAAPTVEDDAPADFALGSTPVTFTACDAAGNCSGHTLTVEIVDATPPTIALDGPAGWIAGDGVIQAEVGDVCGENTTVSFSHAPASQASEGATHFATYADEGTYLAVIVTATDAAGNSASAKATDFAIDRTPPSHDWVELPAAGDEDDTETWPVLYHTLDVGQGFSHQLPLAFDAWDGDGIAVSGLSSVRVFLAHLDGPEPEEDVLLVEGTWQPVGAPVEAPGPVRESLQCTYAELCGEGGLDTSSLPTGRYVLRFEISDVAGNTFEESYHFLLEPVPATAQCQPRTLNLNSRGNWITCRIEALPAAYAGTATLRDIKASSLRIEDPFGGVHWIDLSAPHGAGNGNGPYIFKVEHQPLSDAWMSALGWTPGAGDETQVAFTVRGSFWSDTHGVGGSFAAKDELRVINHGGGNGNGGGRPR
jgi:hypothetical protein